MTPRRVASIGAAGFRLRCWVPNGARNPAEPATSSARGLGLAPPTLAVGYRALAFWGTLRDAFDGKVTEQRCWVPRTANVLDALTKRLHEEAKEPSGPFTTLTAGPTPRTSPPDHDPIHNI
jgi:hypothetical protein